LLPLHDISFFVLRQPVKTPKKCEIIGVLSGLTPHYLGFVLGVLPIWQKKRKMGGKIFPMKTIF